MTTWNWPLFSTTVMTPAMEETVSLAEAGVSFSTRRRRVAQWVAWTMFSGPPTASTMSTASFS